MVGIEMITNNHESNSFWVIDMVGCKFEKLIYYH